MLPIRKFNPEIKDETTKAQTQEEKGLHKVIRRQIRSYIIGVILSLFLCSRIGNIERCRRRMSVSRDRSNHRFWATDQEARDHLHAQRLKVESATNFECVCLVDALVDVGVVEG